MDRIDVKGVLNKPSISYADMKNVIFKNFELKIIFEKPSPPSPKQG